MHTIEKYILFILKFLKLLYNFASINYKFFIMKKIILTIALVFALLKIDAQTQYDTIVYHPYDLSNNYFGSMDLVYHEMRSLECYGCDIGNLPGTNTPCSMVRPITERNEYDIRGVAQPYHFDSTVTVIGIAVKVPTYSLDPSVYGTVYFRIMDMSFKELLAKTPIYPWHTPDSNGYKRHWFFKEIPVKDFVLIGDITPLSQTGFGIIYPCTWSLYDTIGCLENYLRSNGMPYDTMFVGIDYHAQDPYATVTDTLYATTFSENPWLLRNGEWIRFADDPAYNLYQKTFIEFLPILKVARADTTNLAEISIDENIIKLFPNPAKNTLNIESKETIKEIEFYDALGKKVKALTINKKEAIIDIRTLKKGNYVVNIYTDKGKRTKKLVVN